MKNLKKFSSIVLVLALLSALMLTSCGKQESGKNGEDYVFKIGTANGSLCLAPLHIATDILMKNLKMPVSSMNLLKLT